MDKCDKCRFNYGADGNIVGCHTRRIELGAPIVECINDNYAAFEPLEVIINRPKLEDMVNSPPHYNNYNTEVIDVIKSCLTDEQYKGYLLGNMLKYRLRAGFKNDTGLGRDTKRDEDLKKSNWYQDRM